MTECYPLLEIDTRAETRAVTFSPTCEYVVSCDDTGIQVWRVEDGKLMFTSRRAMNVACLAVSKDGEQIGAGTWDGDVIIWDKTKGYERTSLTQGTLLKDVKKPGILLAVDFSADLASLVSASSDCTATVWDVSTHKQVHTLPHDKVVTHAKYSPQSDGLIATVTEGSVHLWKDGLSFLNIPLTVHSLFETGLFWCSEKLFLLSNGKILQVDTTTGTIQASEWQVPETKHRTCIALPQHGKFIAHSAQRTVAFCDTTTHTQLGLIQHPQDIRCIVLSPDDRCVAIAGSGGKISIKSLSRITASIGSVSLARIYPTLQVPDIRIDNAVLEFWQSGQFANAEELLTTSIRESRNVHYTLAGRALVRARLKQWGTALIDAEMSIRSQPSIIGYIAQSIALVGNGERDKGYHVYDITFERFHSRSTFLLLIKAIITFLAGEHVNAICRIDDLIDTAPFIPIYYAVQTHMYLLLGESQKVNGNLKGAIQSLERARTQSRHHAGAALLAISLISGWKFDNLDITVQQRLCEALYAAGRTQDAGEALLTLLNTCDEGAYMSRPFARWVSEFAHYAFSTPESAGDPPSGVAPIRYDPAESGAALHEAGEYTFTNGGFEQIPSEMSQASGATICCESVGVHQVNWAIDFKSHCIERLDFLGDTAMSNGQHDLAISHYSAALALDPHYSTVLAWCPYLQDPLIKRSKVHAASGSWMAALNDANKAIELNPSSPWGYERKHAALHGAGDYKNAVNALEAMFSEMSQSSDALVRAYCCKYVNPGETRKAIQEVVKSTIRDLPRVLINTTSGRLVHRAEQAAAFESLPAIHELISSMTTHLDYARIEKDVTEFYRYAMFSHRWEDNEPLFEQVIRTVVYGLPESPAHNKLQMFCKVARDAGLCWAWSDTCCINKADPVVLQEALVAMFKWYQGSALTIVFLRGVGPRAERGALMRSPWNTRAWTFQEYHASKVILFYTEAWTLYMNLDIPNHKESPEIISEMEDATGFPSQDLVSLQPGVKKIREKLYLASKREATLAEDTAYSLFGIFSVKLPIVYGEEDQALGRLLAQLLTSSGDTRILAWTGESGSFNSCLPVSIAVFSQSPTTHIPLPITSDEMQEIRERTYSSSNLALVMKLCNRLHELPVPSFLGQRMRLPCLTFNLRSVSVTRGQSGYTSRATTDLLGDVEFTTRQDLSHLGSLILVHPWSDFLLDRQPVEIMLKEDQIHSPLTGNYSSLPRLFRSASSAVRTQAGPANWLSVPCATLRPRFACLAEPSYASTRDVVAERDAVAERKKLLSFVARLRKPFGALLLTPTRHNVPEYRRVAADALITVQVKEITRALLKKLISGVQQLDVL